MVSKDQGIGGAILAVCVIVAIGYLVTLFVSTVGSSHIGLHQTAQQTFNSGSSQYQSS